MTTFEQWQQITRHNRQHAKPDDHYATPDAIATMRQDIVDDEQQLTAADSHLTALGRERAVTSLPDPVGWLADQHDSGRWCARR